ncbi:hypothetical protein Klosneuvirus_1_368 [Klosneuvirus KNV1]|uniref:Uncharacterized protein n=1 Tax=Klosneuvirus KNV1 TaxID=1977640 RepID=A0A1V0SIM8_9VIRU|nr:hypothetical protein Klosneuvirus_1_368 [Klosneuvirus KNV1]
MPGIKIAYEMEAIFTPYLTVEFLPRDENELHSGIILLTKSGKIKKNYDFKDPKTKQDLENLIWYHLGQDYNIKEVNEGHENDTREYTDNKVIQGWAEKRRVSSQDICCKKILDAVTNSIMDNLVLHEVYKLKGGDIKDKETCKKVRFSECGDNYPQSSPTFQRCVDEVEWLCDHGYPNNEKVNKMNSLVGKVRKDIYDYLDKNDMKVDKKKFDEIITAGLFADLGNRMGNKVANDPHVRESVNDIFTEKDYYLYLIEDFNTEPKSKYQIWFGLLILLIVIIMIYLAYCNRNK